MTTNINQVFKKALVRRIIFDVFFVATSCIAPWWLLCLLTIAGVFLFGFFWEAVLYAMIIDCVFGVHTVRLGGITYFFTLLTILIITVSLLIRKSTRMYDI